MKNIVILGASYGGIGTAHRILKQAAKTEPFKITLVSPNTHFYWSMASPRGAVSNEIPDDELFLPIAPGFKQYPNAQFEFILASAESLDVNAKTVRVVSADVTKTIDYDYLILATGARTRNGTPFKGLDTTETTLEVLHTFQDRVTKAHTIVVAGGGVTSIEVAGELAFKYGQQKNIYLIASGPTVLPECPESVSKLALKELQKLGITVKFNTKVLGMTPVANGQQELTLSSGDKLVADMYIPAYGLAPNSSYVPSEFLSGSGHVMVDEYLRVRGADGVWAIGDVSDAEPAQFITCDKQSQYLAKSLVSVLNSKTPPPYKKATSRFMGFQIGKHAGTGHWGNMRMPSFIIVYARKNLFRDNLVPTVNGSLF